MNARKLSSVRRSAGRLPRRISLKSENRVGLVETAAGGQRGGDGDGGDPRKAGLDRPHGCVIDDDGTIYIADSNNHRIRRVRFK